MQTKKVLVHAKNGVYIFVCLFVFIGLGKVLHAANNDETQWAKANQFYTQKNYDSAAQLYVSLLKTNEANAMLQYNTGNAYYKLNKIGLAILHYEKAAHLAPGNKEITDNLALAKTRVQDNLPEVAPIFFVSWWYALNHAISANTWAVLAFVMFLGVLALVYYARTKKEAFANSGRWVSLGIVCLLLCASMAFISYNDNTNSNKAVIIDTGAVFLQTPQATGKIIGSLPEGLVLEVLDKQGAYYKVQLQNGKSGWVDGSFVGGV